MNQETSLVHKQLEDISLICLASSQVRPEGKRRAREERARRLLVFGAGLPVNAMKEEIKRKEEEVSSQ